MLKTYHANEEKISCIAGEGEARLAWHDQQIEIKSSNYNAMHAANGLIKTISQKIHLNKYPIGHLKFLLNGEKKISIPIIRRKTYLIISLKKENMPVY